MRKRELKLQFYVSYIENVNGRLAWHGMPLTNLVFSKFSFDPFRSLLLLAPFETI